MKSRTPDGFSLWELMVVIALVIVLGLAAIENLMPLMGDAERAAHASTRGALQSAIGLESTVRVLESGYSGLHAMHHANPVEWLSAPMGNYAGDIASGAYDEIPPRHWGYDPDAGLLVYRVGFPEFFSGSFMTPAAIRFRVVVERGANGVPRGVMLKQIDSGRWITDESVLAKIVGDSHE